MGKKKEPRRYWIERAREVKSRYGDVCPASLDRNSKVQFIKTYYDGSEEFQGKPSLEMLDSQLYQIVRSINNKVYGVIGRYGYNDLEASILENMRKFRNTKKFEKKEEFFERVAIQSMELSDKNWLIPKIDLMIKYLQ